MNYFEWFELPIAFVIDEKELRQRFLARSKQFHPDFHTQANEEAQRQAMELSTFNNQGYRTLADADSRLKYMLTLHNALPDEGQAKLPQDFLMEMMDFNEQLVELEMDFKESLFSSLVAELQKKEGLLYETVKQTLERYDHTKATSSELEMLKNFFLKKRYLLRIRENLRRFAA